ncbi:MAG: hypothetical protein Q8P34_08325 [Bacteroidota bacterium]|nr:hypothetical protein [Bacteroidota bacterium]
MKSNNENPVYFIDQNRMIIAKAEVNLFCTLANSILADLNQLEVNPPEDGEQAKVLIYAGTDKIREIIIQNQLAKMDNLPPAAAEKLVSMPVDALNKLSMKMYSFQNRNSTAKINHVDFATFIDGIFQPQTEKLKKHFTIVRTQTIIEAERLAGEVIDSVNRLKDYCNENGYPGKLVEYESFLNWNESEQNFEINPIGMQYFKQ